jgi:DNA-binding transcriptional LysR family regulator
MADFSVVGLRVLCEVAGRGSFTAAAESLGYTQSAVSRQVAGLEAAAGARLFERASRGVALTDAGRSLLRHAVGVIDQLDAAKHELAGMRELTAGHLRVGAFPMALAALVPRALAAFHSRHPGVEISLREGMTPAQLRRVGSGAVELAVVATLPNQTLEDPHCALEPLFEDRLLLALARNHPLAGQSSVDLDDLTREPWIAGTTDASDPLLGVWPSLKWEPHVAFIARDWIAKLGLVAAGLGVTVVPGLGATAVREDVALVRVRGRRVARTIALATRAGAKPPPHVGAFADVVHEVASDLTVELQRRITER